MPTLDPAERRALRARAHHLHPVVSIGQQGLTPAVLHEIDVNLLAHELVKVRVFSDARGEREALLQRVCAELDAAPVQHVGKVLVIYRAAAPQEDTGRTGPGHRESVRPLRGAARPSTALAAKSGAARRRQAGARADPKTAAGKGGAARRRQDGAQADPKTAAGKRAKPGAKRVPPKQGGRSASTVGGGRDRNAQPEEHRRADRRRDTGRGATAPAGRNTGPAAKPTARQGAGDGRGGPAGVPRAPGRGRATPSPAPAGGAPRTRRRRG